MANINPHTGKPDKVEQVFEEEEDRLLDEHTQAHNTGNRARAREIDHEWDQVEQARQQYRSNPPGPPSFSSEAERREWEEQQGDKALSYSTKSATDERHLLHQMSQGDHTAAGPLADLYEETGHPKAQDARLLADEYVPTDVENSRTHYQGDTPEHRISNRARSMHAHLVDRPINKGDLVNGSYLTPEHPSYHPSRAVGIASVVQRSLGRRLVNLSSNSGNNTWQNHNELSHHATHWLNQRRQQQQGQSQSKALNLTPEQQEQAFDREYDAIHDEMHNDTNPEGREHRQRDRFNRIHATRMAQRDFRAEQGRKPTEVGPNDADQSGGMDSHHESLDRHGRRIYEGYYRLRNAPLDRFDESNYHQLSNLARSENESREVAELSNHLFAQQSQSNQPDTGSKSVDPDEGLTGGPRRYQGNPNNRFDEQYREGMERYTSGGPHGAEENSGVEMMENAERERRDYRNPHHPKKSLIAPCPFVGRKRLDLPMVKAMGPLDPTNLNDARNRFLDREEEIADNHIEEAVEAGFRGPEELDAAPDHPVNRRMRRRYQDLDKRKRESEQRYAREEERRGQQGQKATGPQEAVQDQEASRRNREAYEAKMGEEGKALTWRQYMDMGDEGDRHALRRHLERLEAGGPLDQSERQRQNEVRMFSESAYSSYPFMSSDLSQQQQAHNEVISDKVREEGHQRQQALANRGRGSESASDYLAAQYDPVTARRLLESKTLPSDEPPPAPETLEQPMRRYRYVGGVLSHGRPDSDAQHDAYYDSQGRLVTEPRHKDDMDEVLYFRRQAQDPNARVEEAKALRRLYRKKTLSSVNNNLGGALIAPAQRGDEAPLRRKALSIPTVRPSPFRQDKGVKATGPQEYSQSPLDEPLPEKGKHPAAYAGNVMISARHAPGGITAQEASDLFTQEEEDRATGRGEQNRSQNKGIKATGAGRVHN